MGGGFLTVDIGTLLRKSAYFRVRRLLAYQLQALQARFSLQLTNPVYLVDLRSSRSPGALAWGVCA